MEVILCGVDPAEANEHFYNTPSMCWPYSFWLLCSRGNFENISKSISTDYPDPLQKRTPGVKKYHQTTQDRLSIQQSP